MVIAVGRYGATVWFTSIVANVLYSVDSNMLFDAFLQISMLGQL
jgi:hypothetical protein